MAEQYHDLNPTSVVSAARGFPGQTRGLRFRFEETSRVSFQSLLDYASSPVSNLSSQQTRGLGGPTDAHVFPAAGSHPSMHAKEVEDSRRVSAEPGVAWHRRTGKWTAGTLNDDGKWVHLGSFDSEGEAIAKLRESGMPPPQTPPPRTFNHRLLQFRSRQPNSQALQPCQSSAGSCEGDSTATLKCDSGSMIRWLTSERSAHERSNDRDVQKVILRHNGPKGLGLELVTSIAGVVYVFMRFLV